MRDKRKCLKDLFKKAKLWGLKESEALELESFLLSRKIWTVAEDFCSHQSTKRDKYPVEKYRKAQHILMHLYIYETELSDDTRTAIMKVLHVLYRLAPEEE